jgi:predicted DNA-binding transcriptional regulator AlpA
VNPTNGQTPSPRPADPPAVPEPQPVATPPGLLDALASQRELLAMAVGLLKEKSRPLPRECLDAAELAEALGVGVRSVRTWDAGGLLPKPVRLGGTRVVWPLKELRAWLAAGAPPREEWERMKAERRRQRQRKR